MEDQSALGGWRGWPSTASRFVLAAVFAWAGLAKIADPDAAVRAVRAYKLLPEALVKLFAWGLPFVEIALAVLLFAGLATRLAGLVAAGLLAMFIFSISSAWARDLQIDCGCFGGGGAAHADAAKYLSELARDLGLLVVAAWLAWRPASRLALDTN
ncbi:MAG TPA: MauE/DoxX family redox-associated membrane protein [Acidimicrobiales bacterium]|nr:MauE/DoxX family redox-associated membrane protein [Acidimicrobiales bacterium]